MAYERYKYAIAVGNAWDGIALYGTFDDGSEATEWADQFFKNEEWHCVKIKDATLIGKLGD